MFVCVWKMHNDVSRGKILCFKLFCSFLQLVRSKISECHCILLKKTSNQAPFNTTIKLFLIKTFSKKKFVRFWMVKQYKNFRYTDKMNKCCGCELLNTSIVNVMNYTWGNSYLCELHTPLQIAETLVWLKDWWKKSELRGEKWSCSI